MNKPRFEAAGKYVIDWQRKRLSSTFGDSDSAKECADRWNEDIKQGKHKEDPDEYDWAFGAGDASPSQVKPADCTDHYWAAPYQCMEVRDAIVGECPKSIHSLVIADWCQLFQYVWRVLRKGQTISDLRKIEHYARILRERLEGRK